MTGNRRIACLTAIGLLLFSLVLAGCTQLVDELFNSNFLVDVGAGTSAELQITPSNEALLLVKVSNQTDYPVTIKTELLRRDSGTTDGPSFELLESGQSVGELLEHCDTDPVQIIRIKPLVSETVGGTTVEIPEAYVWVGGLPIAPSSVAQPLFINDHFECGDTVEYIVQSLPAERNRFRVVAVVYSAGL